MDVQNYINGELRDSISGQSLPNVNPATAEKIGDVPASSKEDVHLAAQAATAALPNWRTVSVDERSTILHRIADRIDARVEDFARAETTDTGKPLTLARAVDAKRAAENFRFYANHMLTFFDENYLDPEKKLASKVLRPELGVVACISPWNLPVYLLSWKVAPALAAGNCVIAKPSELTPTTASMLAELTGEAGLPPGVLNLIHGRGAEAGVALCQHEDIAAISFTGGTKTGAEVKQRAMAGGKRVTLELGGKNPNIIFEDCDYEAALSTSLRSAFANQGQICLCGSRILVQRSLYDRFRSDFVRRAGELIVGDPLDEKVNLGSVISEDHMNKILGYIELAKSEGGSILLGGGRQELDGRCSKGFFVQPTIIEGLSNACRVNQEEIFGPVVTLIPFDTEEEALQIANGTEYGLAASVWTENRARAERMAACLDFGIVWLNCWLARDLRTPFGGMKSSGDGREGGDDALRFFTKQPTAVTWMTGEN